MIVKFRSIHPGTVYRFEIDKVSCRGSCIYFWRGEYPHYYLEYDIDSGRLLEYRVELSYDTPYEYHVQFYWDVVA